MNHTQQNYLTFDLVDDLMEVGYPKKEQEPILWQQAIAWLLSKGLYAYAVPIEHGEFNEVYWLPLVMDLTQPVNGEGFELHELDMTTSLEAAIEVSILESIELLKMRNDENV